MDLVKRQNTCNANSPSSYSAFASLEDNMLTEILCRLPCKSIHQFKCVCKHWFSIISNSYFIQRFRSVHPQPPPFALLIKCHDGINGQEKLKLLVTSKETDFQSQECSLSFLPCFKTDKRYPVKIIASCNGLLLCCAVPEACPTVYYICNPLTKQWFALPPVYHRAKEAYAGLICENNSNQYGFRVVCMINVCNYKFGYSTVKIFSSETGKWSETIHKYQIQDFTRWILLYKTVIVCDGMLYWWSRFRGGFVTCDMDGNLRFSLNYYPEDFTLRFGERPGLGVCKGRFCLAQLSSEPESPSDFATLKVWHLEDRDRGKWCLKHEVPLNELKSEVIRLVKYAKSTAPVFPFQFLSFHPYSENTIYMSDPHCIVSCNLERKTLEIVSEIPSENISYWCLACPFELHWWPSPIPSSINLSDSHITSV